MASSEPRISVRVEPKLKERLEEAVRNTGIDEPTLVKRCVEAMLDYIEKNRCITFPLSVTPMTKPGAPAKGKYPYPRRQHISLNETANSTNPSAQQAAEKEADGIVAHVLSRSKRGKRKTVSPKRPNPPASSPPIGGKT